MKKVDPEDAVKKRFPEGVALVVCKDDKGMVDVTPIGWFMLCNSRPRCWAISLYQKHYSHKVISETGEFSLCLPSFSQKKDVLFCGSVSGWKEDKLKKCNFLKTIDPRLIKAPMLEDCVAGFECKVIEKTKAPDHTIFIGEIVAAYISDKRDKIYNRGSRDLFEWEIE